MSGDTYRTIQKPSYLELPKIKGSRFIGDACPASSEKKAKEVIAQIREREPTATHHCWAYRIGRKGKIFRYDDDGEPSGTAGQPILKHIDGRGLVNVVVVVTRYYGGTLLGAGGLVHAYGKASGAVLDAATTVEKVVRQTLRLSFGYNDTSTVMQVLHRFDAKVADSNYTDVTELVVQVRQSQVKAFQETISNALGGRSFQLSNE